MDITEDHVLPVKSQGEESQINSNENLIIVLKKKGKKIMKKQQQVPLYAVCDNQRSIHYLGGLKVSKILWF
jgi:hypothetical protein